MLIQSSTYAISSFDILANDVPNNSNAPSLQRIGWVFIDVNGTTGPNRAGRDVFVFILWNDGTIKAKGAHGWDGTNNNLWNGKCDQNGVSDGTFCAGSIFENNIKVIYKKTP